mmetsp:Transcript_35021/g.76319  ORF Transcript_35021/g.76319 Transcript_35021/m.76319 type:complete len:211 (-) Transcript_35021:52-684(-)
MSPGRQVRPPSHHWAPPRPQKWLPQERDLPLGCCLRVKLTLRQQELRTNCPRRCRCSSRSSTTTFKRRSLSSRNAPITSRARTASSQSIISSSRSASLCSCRRRTRRSTQCRRRTSPLGRPSVSRHRLPAGPRPRRPRHRRSQGCRRRRSSLEGLSSTSPSANKASPRKCRGGAPSCRLTPTSCLRSCLRPCLRPYLRPCLRSCLGPCLR